MLIKTIRRGIIRPTLRQILQGNSGGGGGGVSVHYASEWRYDTGTSDLALRDGGKFTNRHGTLGNGAAVVVAPTGLGLNGRGNLVRVRALGLVNQTVSEDNFVPQDTNHWGRWYVRSGLTVDYPFNHLLAYGGLGGIPIQVALGVAHITEFSTPEQRWFLNPQFDSSGTDLTYPNQVYAFGTQGVALYDSFPVDTWFLWEWGIEYLTGLGIFLRCWISEVDSDGMITNPDIYTNARLFQQDYFGGAGGNLEARQGSTINFGRSPGADGITGMRRIVLGNESSNGTATNEDVYFASFGVSLEGRLYDQDLGLG